MDVVEQRQSPVGVGILLGALHANKESTASLDELTTRLEVVSGWSERRISSFTILFSFLSVIIFTL